MESRGTERRSSEYSENSGLFLASRYAQLMRWAIVLARNDQATAEEIVQEFCLYVTLAKPDFSHVTGVEIHQDILLKTTMDTNGINDSSRMADLAARLNEAADGKRAAASIE